MASSGRLSQFGKRDRYVPRHLRKRTTPLPNRRLTAVALTLVLVAEILVGIVAPTPALANGTAITQITTGGGHTSCAVWNNGAGYCWGLNDAYQLGTGNTTNSSVPVPVTGGPWKQLSTAGGNSCGINTSNVAYCWGAQAFGQNGNNSTTTLTTPTIVNGGLTWKMIDAGRRVTCGVTTTDVGYCWGNNTFGQIGNNSTTDVRVPTAVNGGLSFSTISVGFYSTCGLTTTGSAYCWGDNTTGQLGNNSNTQSNVPVLVQGGYTWASIDAGYGASTGTSANGNTACGVTTTGVGYCWGANEKSQVGDGTTTQQKVPKIISGGYTWASIDSGSGYACGITTAGAGYCWGDNSTYQLGDNTVTTRTTPTAINGGYTWKLIATGGGLNTGGSQQPSTCAVTTSEKMYCWGGNLNGEVGDNTSGTARQVPTAVYQGIPADFVYGQGGSFTTSGTAISATGLTTPDMTTIDTVHHRMFVGDGGNHRVLVYNLDSANRPTDDVADYYLGQGSMTSATGSNAQNRLNDPEAMAYDPVGDRLFVADYGNNRVVIYDTSALASGMNASVVLGQSGWGTSTAATTQAGMRNPGDVTYDIAGKRLFVSDYNNHRVLMFDVAAPTNGMNATAVLGQGSWTSTTTAATQSGMGEPVGVSYDASANYLYVAIDNQNRVMVFDVATVTSNENAQYVLGQSTWSGIGSGLTATTLNYPAGVSATGAYIYVADSANNRTVGYPKASLANGMAATVVYGQPNFTTNTPSVTRMSQKPWGAMFDPTSGLLWTGDAGTNRILTYSVSAPPTTPSTLAQYKSDGTTNLSVGSTAGTSTMVFKGLTADTDTADTNQLCVEIELTSVAFNNLDTACGTAVTQGGTASVSISGLAYGSSYHWQARTKDNYGAVSSWAAFGGNSDTVTAATDVNIYPGIPADYVYGQGGSYTSSAQTTTATGMDQPEGVAIDTVHHRLFVCDRVNDRVLVFNLDANNKTIDDTADYVLGQTSMTSTLSGASQTTFSNPGTLAYDPIADRLFVGELTANRVMVFDTASITNGEAAVYVIGKSDYVTTTAAAGQNTTGKVTGVAFDWVNSRLFVADQYCRVLVFNTGSIATGMNASYVIGQTTYSATSCAASQTKFLGTAGMSFDNANNDLWVAEYDSSRVLMFDMASLGTGMSASYVLGQTTWTGSGFSTTQSTFKYANGVSAEGRYVYVSDLGNRRILAFDKNSLANGMNASAVYGQVDYTSVTTATTQYFMAGATNLAFDPSSGILYAADGNSSRVTAYYTDNAPTTPTALAQYKSDGTTALATGDWNNSTTAVFKAMTADTDATDTNQLCVEVRPVNTAFTGNPTACGTAVTQGNLATVTVASLSNTTQHHWQARTVDSSGVFSPWASYGGNSDTITAATDFGIDTTAPSTAASLAQFQSNGTTSIAVGGYASSTTVVLKATVTDATSQASLCIEKDLVSVSFSNTEDQCSTLVASGGTAVVTVSGLSVGALYHWQGRVRDSAGNYSGWLSFGGNSDTITAATDFGVDGTAPTTGTVYDGSSAGVQSRYNTGSLSSLSGNWSGFSDAGSGIATYTYSIGTTPGATDVLTAQSTATTSFTANSLVLRTSQVYYVNVSATDAAGNVSSVVSSPGQYVAPTLTFSLAPSTITFAKLNPGNSYTDTKSVTATTSTNGYGGYVLRQYATAPLTNGAKTVTAYTGTYAAPTTWTGTGFGYTSNDATIQGSGNLFASATKYAALASSGPGDIVADHTAAISGSPVASEPFILTYRVTVPSNQASGTYSTSVRIGATVTI